MPTYKITQQQGNRVITSTLESSSAENVLAFLKEVSTAEVKYIYRVEYENPSEIYPADDFLYYKQFKAFAKNDNNMSKQILIHNVKKSKSELEISDAIKRYLSVGGVKPNSVSCSLFM